MYRDNSERLKSVTDLVEIAGKMNASTVVIAGGHRIEDLRLVESARDHGIINRIILVGQESLVHAAVKEVGIEIEADDIVPAEGDEAIAATTVELIRSGGVDIVLKGGISTPVINRHMLKLSVRPTVSLASIFEASPIAECRPIVLTDAGVTTICNFGRMGNLIDNAVEVAKVVMGIDRPRVAILSANEKQIPSLPSTWIGRKLAERQRPDAVVCGPLSFDLATDPESVAVKGFPHLPNANEVAGRADILVCPGIDTANILYKTITAMTKFGQASLAGITVGFPVPYIILSRADTLETRLLSIALCSIYAQRTFGRQQSCREGVKPSATVTFKVLAINLGSTSIKLALYENHHPVHENEVSYRVHALSTSNEFGVQIKEISELVCKMLNQWGKDRVDAIAVRRGFKPRTSGKQAGGTYVIAELRDNQVVVDQNLVNAIIGHPEKDYASKLGIPVAAELAEQFKVPAYAVDPVVVDEFIPEAEISGYAPIVRRSISDTLSVSAAAIKAARAIGRPLDDINLVVAHLGEGITVAAVRMGKMIDNNSALLDGGPFTPQRAGRLPIDGLIDLCYSGRFTREELITELTRRGGFRSYLGEYRIEVIEQRIADGDEDARAIVNAMVYQIAKEIGGMFVSAGCDVEAIVLTGGLTRSSFIRDSLRRRIVKMAPVLIFEGSLEMETLALGAIDILSGRTIPHHYGK